MTPSLIIPKIPIHPDDIVLFDEIRTAIQSVAKEYELTLKEVVGYPMPEAGMSDRWGDCKWDGTIRLVLRCTVDGEWCNAPCSPDEVWDTAAHELAHLALCRLRPVGFGANHAEIQLAAEDAERAQKDSLEHGPLWTAIYAEMKTAIANRRVDHKQKVIDKLLKMQRQRDGEAALHNQHAAEAFAAAINRMMIEHELSPSDLDYAQATDKDPIIEVYSDPRKWKDEPTDWMKYLSRHRIAWQESLARIVANAHLCKFLVSRKSNEVWFVGTRSHALVAEYVFSVLVPNAYWMSKIEADQFKKRNGKTAAQGFRDSWLNAFVRRIEERLEAARREAISATVGDKSTALIRLSGALRKAQEYCDHKFAGYRGKPLAGLQTKDGFNRAGRDAGRAAADRMPIGTKGVDGGTTKKSIGGGS